MAPSLPPRPPSPLVAAGPRAPAPPLAPLANALVAAPDGEHVVYLGEPNALCLLAVEKGEGGDDRALPTLRIADAATLGDDVCAAAWGGGGGATTRPLLVVATRSALEFFAVDAATSRLVRRSPPLPLGFWPRSVAVAPHPNPAPAAAWLVAAAGGPGVVLWRAESAGGAASSPLTATRVRALGAPWPAVAVALTADGGAVAGAGAAGQVWVWRVAAADDGAAAPAAPPSLAAPTPELHAQVPAERVTSLVFSPGGDALLAAAWRGGVWRFARRHTPGVRLHPRSACCPPAGAPAPSLLAVEPSSEDGGAPAAEWELEGAVAGGADAIAPAAAPPTLLQWSHGGAAPVLVARGASLVALDGDTLSVAWTVGAAASEDAEAATPPPPPAPVPSSLPLPPRAVAPGPVPPPFTRPPRGGVRGVAVVAGGHALAWCDGDGRCGVVEWGRIKQT